MWCVGGMIYIERENDHAVCADWGILWCTHIFSVAFSSHGFERRIGWIQNSRQNSAPEEVVRYVVGIIGRRIATYMIILERIAATMAKRCSAN